MRKYRNKKIVRDEHLFDSKKEADRYSELKLLQLAGKIKNLELQPVFILQDSFRKNGKTYQAIKYRADFRYIDSQTGETVVEDVKGLKTQVYAIKKKMFERRYPDLTIREI